MSISNKLKDIVVVIGYFILCAEAVGGLVFFTRMELDTLISSIAQIHVTQSFLTALLILFIFFAKAYTIYDFIKEEIEGENT